jgi:hypothetical protein
MHGSIREMSAHTSKTNGHRQVFNKVVCIDFMLVNKTWRLLSPDDNTGGASSNSPDDKGADSSQQQQDDKTQQQSDDGQQGDQQSTDAGDGDGSSTDTTGENADGQDNSQQGDDQGQDGQQQQQQAEPVVDKAGDENLRFSSHPRWKELVTEKNQFKQEIDQVKPLVEQAKVTNDFLRDNGISAQEYQAALQYLVALRKDPQQAYAMMKPTFEQLALMTGERLPADLQAKVAAGVISAEDATELARTRAQANYQKWQQQNQQTGQQDQTAAMLRGSIQSWTQLKQVSEPDFKPNTPLWEQVDLRIRAMPPFRTSQEAMTGCEKALTEAKAFLGKFQKVQPQQQRQVRQPLKSQNNGGNNQTVIKTAEDVARAINAGMKPSQLRYQ